MRKIKLEDFKENFRDQEGYAFVRRCPACRLENWAPAVATGKCNWCGWKDRKRRGESDEAIQG